MQATAIFHIPKDILHALLKHLPSRAGVFLRRLVYRHFLSDSGIFDMETAVDLSGFSGISIGSGTTFLSHCDLHADNASLTIGKNCFFGKNVRLGADGGGETIINDNVMVGPNVVIDPSMHNHKTTQIPMKNQGLSHGIILIEEDVWIGANAVILKDITIGKGSIVGAGAVVTHDVPAYSVVGGVPATIIKSRKPQ